MSILRSAAQGGPSAKSVKVSKKGDLLGVCIIGKLDEALGTYSELYSGSLVKGLSDYSGSADEDIFIVTSDKIVPPANRQNQGTESTTLKLNSLKASDYKLCFKNWSSDKKQRSYELDKVTDSEASVKLISGMAMIPLDSQKVKGRSLVSGKSGLLTYRPFRANKVSVASLKGSDCLIVEGNMESFGMVPFNLVLDDSGKYVLKLQQGEVNFETRTQITGGETNNRRPSGAVIVRRQESMTGRSEAIAVLNFVNNKVSPVLFPRLQAVGISPELPPNSSLHEGTGAESQNVDTGSALNMPSGMQTLHSQAEQELPPNSSLHEGTGAESQNVDTGSALNMPSDMQTLHSQAEQGISPELPPDSSLHEGTGAESQNVDTGNALNMPSGMQTLHSQAEQGNKRKETNQEGKLKRLGIGKKRIKIRGEQSDNDTRTFLDIQISVERYERRGSSCLPNDLRQGDAERQSEREISTPLEQLQAESLPRLSTGQLLANPQNTQLVEYSRVILSFPNPSMQLGIYLQDDLNLDIQDELIGSLVITVSCSSLQVLERLWDDYCSGHLAEVVQQTLVTREVLNELSLSEVKLKTIISAEEYSVCKDFFMSRSGSSGKTNNQKKAEKSAVETEHKEEEDRPPTENKVLSGNEERRSSKDAVAVQTPAHDEASAVQGKALPIVTGRENFAPKRNNAAENLDGMTSNEASGHKSSGDRSLDEVVIEPESNNKTPVSASAGQGNDKVLLSNRNRSLDQASQHGAALTESAETATAPEYAVQENNCATAPKFENHIKDVHGNLLIGDHINATIGSNSSINASQHQAALTESTNTAATPEHAVQEDNHATVSKFENHIEDVHGNLLIGDHINATIGANSSINEPRRRPAQNAETPGAATPGPSVAPQRQSAPATAPEGAAREPSVRHANSGPRPEYVNRIQGVGPDSNVIIGDHASVNIESSSGRRTTGLSNTRGSSGP